jgi:hypothetical protein
MLLPKKPLMSKDPIMPNAFSDNGDAHAATVADAARAITGKLRGRYAVRKETYGQSDDSSDNDRQSYLSAGLKDYSTSTLQKIISMQSDAGVENHYNLIDLIIRGDLRVHDSFVNDYLHLADCFTTAIRYKRVAQAALAIEALSNYEGLAPYFPGEDYPAQRATHGTAIVSVTAHLRAAITAGDLPEETLTREMFGSENEALADIIYDFSDAHLRIITDKRLRSLLTDPDYDPSSIAKIITERNLLDPDDIIAVLESQKDTPSQAVNEGIL